MEASIYDLSAWRAARKIVEEMPLNLSSREQKLFIKNVFKEEIASFVRAFFVKTVNKNTGDIMGISVRFRTAALEYFIANLQNYNGMVSRRAPTTEAVFERLKKVTKILEKTSQNVKKEKIVREFNRLSVKMIKHGYDPERVRVIARKGINTTDHTKSKGVSP